MFSDLGLESLTINGFIQSSIESIKSIHLSIKFIKSCDFVGTAKMYRSEGALVIHRRLTILSIISFQSWHRHPI